MRPITQITDEIYSIVYGHDLKPMKDLIFKRFKAKTLFALNNKQLESIVPEIRELYGINKIDKEPIC